MSLKGLLNILLLLISIDILSQDGGKTIPFTLVNNHIYIQGHLNDTLDVSILLDCGSGTILTEEQAKKAKIKTHPQGQTIGIGNNTVPYHITDSISFNLGSIRYTEKRIPVLSFREIDSCGALISVDKEGWLTYHKKPGNHLQRIDAVLGDKFFRKFVVKIDYEKQYLTLYEPPTYQYNGKGERLSLLYADNHIYVSASVTRQDSISASGYFMVDCGNMSGLILNVPFIKQHNISPSIGATEISMCGIGGSSKSMMGTLPDLQIGKNIINKPVTLFSQATGGVLTKSDVAGNIGNAILRKFTVILDYSRQQMILE